MKLHLPRVCLVGLASGVCAAAFAQSDIPIEYLKPLNNSFSFGLRATGHGVKVKFGNLGTVAPNNFDAALGITPSASRVYDDGQVLQDSQRINESVTTTVLGDDGVTVVSSTTTQLPVVNGRYKTVSTGSRLSADGVTQESADTFTGDYLAYAAGQTREWSYNNASQLSESPGQVAMHSYSAFSDGASTTGEGSAAGGIELEVAHTFGRIGNHLEWGLSLSFGLNDISVKSTAVIHSTLHTLTDYYSLQGATAPAAPYNAVGVADATDYTNVFQDTGATVTSTDTTVDPAVTSDVITTGGQENTTPLAQEPTSRTETDVKGAATITGHWQIKGAYYMLKAGPTLRYNFTPKIALSASAGAAFAYISTKYRVDETLTLPDGGVATAVGEGLPERKLKPGYYGNINAEYWMTQRTGVYGGVTYEKVGAYDQVLAGRTAHIDIGSGMGFRFGLTTRF